MRVFFFISTFSLPKRRTLNRDVQLEYDVILANVNDSAQGTDLLQPPLPCLHQ